MLVALLLAQGLHAGGSLGVGTAYDGAGVRVQAGTQHLEFWNLGAFFVEAGAGAGGYRERLPQAGMFGTGDAGRALSSVRRVGR